MAKTRHLTLVMGFAYTNYEECGAICRADKAKGYTVNCNEQVIRCM